MTRLRKMRLEELERRNYSEGTTRCYLRAVADFARYFHRSPDQLRAEHVPEYQAYLFRQRKLQASSVTQRLAALPFFFLKTLKKRWSIEETPLPQEGASPAHRAQSGGNRPAHPFRSHPFLSHPGDERGARNAVGDGEHPMIIVLRLTAAQLVLRSPPLLFARVS
jgi:hypothetical protein